MRKDVDIDKVRAAILSLQSNMKAEYAQEVWNLLDWYVSQPAQPIVFHPTTTALEDALAGGFGPVSPVYVDKVLAKARTERASRGASAWDHLPKCQVSRYNPAESHCPNAATGALNAHTNDKSWKVCATHGELYGSANSEHAVDWIQLFFGDENSTADVAEFSQRLKDMEEARDLQCKLGGHLYGADYVGKCSRPATGYITLKGVDVDGCEPCGMQHGTSKAPFVLYA